MSGHNTGAGLPVRRGTSNADARGNSTDRRRRREYLVETYRADVDLFRVKFDYDDEPMVDVFVEPVLSLMTYPAVEWVEVVPACRCYRCGRLLTVDTVTVDRIVPGCQGGTYRRTNIRPACGDCNSETGSRVRR